MTLGALFATAPEASAAPPPDNGTTIDIDPTGTPDTNRHCTWYWHTLSRHCSSTEEVLIGHQGVDYVCFIEHTWIENVFGTTVWSDYDADCFRA